MSIPLDASVTAVGLMQIDEANTINLLDVDTINGPITIVSGGTLTATDVQSLTDADANDITLTANIGDLIAVLSTPEPLQAMSI